MTPANLNPEQSRRLAIGLLFAAIVAAIAIVAIPLWMLNRHYETALQESLSMLERYRRIAASRSELTTQLEAMRHIEPQRYFLRQGAPALSAAEAQEAIRNLVEASGGRLITMQAPTGRDDGRYRQVTVTVQLTANVIALRKLLHAIETRTPYLFVDSLMVRSQVPANFKPGPGAEPEMFVQLEVSGYAFGRPA
jgi:general secretion pathway protein M